MQSRAAHACTSARENASKERRETGRRRYNILSPLSLSNEWDSCENEARKEGRRLKRRASEADPDKYEERRMFDRFCASGKTSGIHADALTKGTTGVILDY